MFTEQPGHRLHARPARAWRTRAARCASGLYPAKLTPGSKAAAVYGQEVIYERHRHRFEVNNRYRQTLEAAGMILSGQSPDGRLVEIVELSDHPWFVASQFHPEFKRRPERPHPLFDGFVAAALAVRDGREPGLRRPPGRRRPSPRRPAATATNDVDRVRPQRLTATRGRRSTQRPTTPSSERARMKIFLDTADIEEIRTVARWGVLDGVTTNPTLYAKVGGSYDEILQQVCKITPGPGLGRGRRRRRRRDARGGPPLREARPEHRGQGRDVRERPRGDQPLRRRGHQDQLHADLHGQPGPARGQGRRVAASRRSSAASTTSTRTA